MVGRIKCPAMGCDKTFSSHRAAAIHIDEDHINRLQAAEIVCQCAADACNMMAERDGILRQHVFYNLQEAISAHAAMVRGYPAVSDDDLAQLRSESKAWSIMIQIVAKFEEERDDNKRLRLWLEELAELPCCGASDCSQENPTCAGAKARAALKGTKHPKQLNPFLD